MAKLLASYKSYKPSDRCWLDGGYFNEVFADYEGLVEDQIVISIDSDLEGSLESIPNEFNLDSNRIVRVIIDVDYGDFSAKHSNLIIIEPSTQSVYLFEPVSETLFHAIIRDHLLQYLADITPNYHLIDLDVHPEVYDRECASKGMCVAYVIKAALMFVLNKEISFSEDPNDIKRFAAAIESNY